MKLPNIPNVLNKVPARIQRPVTRVLMKGQVHSPTLLFGAGVVGFGATVVLACRATLKLEDVLIDAQKDMSLARELQSTLYSDQDRKRDLSIIYVRTGVRITKLYGPALIVGGLSVAALTGSHSILSKRNAGLSAAYAAMDKAFSQYRAKVVDELGEDKERELRFNSETHVIVEDTEKGPKKKKLTTVGRNGYSPYAKFFDENNQNWNITPEYNILFLRGVQNWLNDKLKARGHVFLNDAYDELGLDRTEAGSQVGWWYDPSDTTRDNYIDFGIWADDRRLDMLDFVTHREDGIMLDFNVDGEVNRFLRKF